MYVKTAILLIIQFSKSLVWRLCVHNWISGFEFITNINQLINNYHELKN